MKPEILAPVSSYESLSAAIKGGADSIYFGIDKLNMRSKKTLKLEDLKKISKIAQKNKVKTYLTVNSVMYDKDIETMKEIVQEAQKNKITAVIATDMATIQYAKSINMPVNISTQANVSNLEAVKFYAKYADAIILARELNLEQIKYITEQIKTQNITGPSNNLIKIEIFIHGALCVAISGKCYMSLATYNKSANRGQCVQPCRRKYKITDTETNKELNIENKYVMSPKDLCTIRVFDQILKTGASILKIEGRNRSPEYVYKTTKIYKEALNYKKDKVKHWEEQLNEVYNRGFWHGGYYLANELGEWCNSYGSKSSKEKFYSAKAINYYTKKGIAHFQVESNELKVGDNILIIGPTTGVIETKIKEMLVNEKESKIANKGDEVTFKLKEKVRESDKLYVLKARTV